VIGLPLLFMYWMTSLLSTDKNAQPIGMMPIAVFARHDELLYTVKQLRIADHGIFVNEFNVFPPTHNADILATVNGIIVKITDLISKHVQRRAFHIVGSSELRKLLLGMIIACDICKDHSNSIQFRMINNRAKTQLVTHT